jgi:hypothetical protein
LFVKNGRRKLFLRFVVKSSLHQTATPWHGSKFSASGVQQAAKPVGNNKYSARDQHAN